MVFYFPVGGRLMYKSKLTAKNIAIIIAITYIIINIYWFVLFQGNDGMIKLGANFFQTTGPLVAAIWLFQRYKKEVGPLKKFWLYPCLANLSYIIAMLCYMYYDLYLNIEAPSPGIPDVFWMFMTGFYLMTFLYLAFLNSQSTRTIQLIFDTLIVMVVATTLSWEYLIKDIVLNFEEFSLLHKLVYIGYPIGDLGILFGLLMVFNMTSKRISSSSFFLMFVGMLSFLIADSIYLYLVSNDLYYLGHFVDILWPTGMLLFALASFDNKKHDLNDVKQTTDVESMKGIRMQHLFSFQLWLPYISVMVLAVIILFKGIHFTSFFVGLMFSVLLIIFRQILTLIENNILLEKSVSVNKELEFLVQQRTVELHSKNQELEASIQKVEYLAYHDTLTGLPNRRFFELSLDKMLHKPLENKQLAILFLDLDRFKLINDTLSHAVGDILLLQVGTRLKAVVQENDIICRQGGDEFLVLLTNSDHDQAVKIANEIILSLAKVFRIEGHEIYITASIGISLCPDHGTNLDLLIKRADAAMYAVKEDGKNNCQIFTHDLDEIITSRVNLENGLRTAIERNEFLLYYQPKWDVTSKEIVGMEALLRWKHSKIGFISPSSFIPIAEETGAINKIGDWVLEGACRQNKQWQKEGLPMLCVSVNVSALQFLQLDFYERVTRILDITKLDAQYLEIEITESIMQNSYQVSAVLSKLRKLGIKVSLDDFGSGFSSLNQIRHLPLDIIKIDKAFIDEITVNSKDQAIVKTILALGQSLGLTVIAEGVEDEVQLRYLQENGCNQIQGYLISPPLPADKFAENLKLKSYQHLITI